MSSRTKKQAFTRKKKRRRRITLFVVLPILILGFAAVVYGSHLYSQFKKTMADSYEEIEGREKSPVRDEAIKINKDHFSMLIIGVDGVDGNERRGNSESSRSDALLLVTVNQSDHTAKMLSIPRDSYVYIPEVGYKTRINHAHAYGGPKATIETVENLFDIPVDYYVRVNFQAFMEIIDALGGIEIDVPFAFSEQDSNDKAGAISLKPGQQTLNGEEALALARTRKIDNDIERGKRQQEIIKATMLKAASLKSISKFDDVFDAVGSNMKTNLTFEEMKYLAEFAIKNRLSIDSLTLAGSDYWPNGVYYYQLDETAVSELKETLRNHLELGNN